MYNFLHSFYGFIIIPVEHYSNEIVERTEENVYLVEKVSKSPYVEITVILNATKSVTS